jgi:hypothetical protein
MTPQQPPIRSLFATGSPPTLAQAVAEWAYPRNRATAQLTAHRDELLRLRRDGASVESLVGGLRRLGVQIGSETLRVWLNRELGIKQRRPRKRPRIESKSKLEHLSGSPPVNPAPEPVEPVSPLSEV